MGRSLYTLGRHEEALSFQKAALIMACGIFRQTHPDVMLYLENIIFILKRLNNQTLIEATKKEIYPICVEILNEAHPKVQELMTGDKEEE